MSNNRLEAQDPRTQYPQPPFEQQHQSHPGLAKDMNPQPDNGEQTYTGSGKLKGRKALVTGADSGVGRAVAIAFAREGADVAISYLPSEEADAKQVMAAIENSGVKGFALPGDLSGENFCKDLVEKAHGRLGGLDILVNNAGTMQTHTELTEISSADFDKVMKTNVYSLFWITKAAIPLLKPGASVINTASIQAYDPSSGIVDYAMTKAAIVAFTKGMVKQLMEKGVRINAVAPGPFWTPIQPLRAACGEGRRAREERSPGSPRPAGRDRAGVRSAGLAGGQLHHRRGVRRNRGHDPRRIAGQYAQRIRARHKHSVFR